jgi:hypothetical protein
VPVAGRPPGAEVGEAVVGVRRGAPVVHRTDGEDPRVVTGLGDRPCARAAVAGGDDDDDAGVPRPLHRVVERVDPPRLPRVGAEGEVEDADPVAVPVLHGPLDGGEDLADVEDPSRPATLIDRRSAPGAIPAWRPSEPAPLPAMIPAMNVPWP